jgi:hypothetical protein
MGIPVALEEPRPPAVVRISLKTAIFKRGSLARAVVPARRTQARELEARVSGPTGPASPCKVGIDLRDDVRVVGYDPPVFIHGDSLEFPSYTSDALQPAEI